MDAHGQENMALRVSTIGTGCLALLGIGFSLFINSDAILLDAFYNALSFVMSLGTLWVTWLIQQPENQLFQFGYMGFVPLTNILKGLLVSIVSLFAGFSAVQAIIAGGREVNATLAIIYSVIAATTCLLITLYQWKVNQKAQSILLQVDIKNWLLNGLISLSVGLAFTIAGWIQNTPLAGLVPYIDSILVLIVAGLTLPMPLKVVILNLRQLLWGAPSSERQTQIKSSFDQLISALPYQHIWVRTAEMGKFVYIHAYWLLPEELSFTLPELDQMRSQVTHALQKDIPGLEVDIIFTQDEESIAIINKSTCLQWLQNVS